MELQYRSPFSQLDFGSSQWLCWSDRRHQIEPSHRDFFSLEDLELLSVVKITFSSLSRQDQRLCVFFVIEFFPYRHSLSHEHNFSFLRPLC